MVSYAQLWNMELGKLNAAASNAGSLASKLATRGTEVAAAADIPGSDWAGADANAASSLLSPQSTPLWDASDSFNAGQGILQDLAAELGSAKELLSEAHSVVAGTAATINSDGDVIVPDGLDEEEDARAHRAASQARAIISDALEQANTSDDNASSALRNWTIHGPYGTPGEGTPFSGEWWRELKDHTWQTVGDTLRSIGDHFRENTSLNGPAVGGSYDGTESHRTNRRGNTAESLSDSDSDSDVSGSLTWRLVDGGYSSEYELPNSTLSAQAGGQVSGSVGQFNSIDASIGASVGQTAERSWDAGPFTLTASGGEQAGVGAGYGADFGVQDGQFQMGAGGKGSIGVGAAGSLSLSVDLQQVADGWADNRREFEEEILRPLSDPSDPRWPFNGPNMPRS